MPQTHTYDKFAKNPTTGQFYGLTGNTWVPITRDEFLRAKEIPAPEEKMPNFIFPQDIPKAVEWVRTHPQQEKKGIEQSKATLRSVAPPLVAGLATLPAGGEGVWPIIARIALSGGAAGLTELGLGGSGKESAVQAAEQGGLQGATEGGSAALKALADRLLSKSAAEGVTIAGKDFPLIRGQKGAESTALGKVARGMSESFVGGPIAKRLSDQDQIFKALVSQAGERVGGVKGAPENFIENTFRNAESVLDKAGARYDAIEKALPDELTPAQEALKKAEVYMKDFQVPSDPAQRAVVEGSLTPEEKYILAHPDEEILSARDQYAKLQKARSAASQAANSAFKRGLQGGSFAEYAARRAEAGGLDKKIVSLLSQQDPKLAAEYLKANAVHAQGRGVERFGMMLDNLTTGLSKAEAAASGIPSSEVPAQKLDYGRLLEALREFNSRGNFSSDVTLERLYGKQAADDIVRTNNLVSKAAKSPLGIVAHYATTVGPAVGATVEALRLNPHAAVAALGTYPALWTVSKLLSYPSFSEPFGKLMLSAAGSKEAALWSARAAQAAYGILKNPQQQQGQTPVPKQ